MSKEFIPLKDKKTKWEDVKFEEMYDDETDPKICKIEYSAECKQP